MQIISIAELTHVTGGAADQRPPTWPVQAQMAPARLGELAKVQPPAEAKEGSIFPPWWQWPTSR